jgi:hypothetical protein
MLSKFAIKLLTRPCLPMRFFSTNSQKLQGLLGRIQVQNESGKTTGLLESGLIVGQHIDPSSAKVTISLNLSKDYRRIKALLKSELES